MTAGETESVTMPTEGENSGIEIVVDGVLRTFETTEEAAKWLLEHYMQKQ